MIHNPKIPFDDMSFAMSDILMRVSYPLIHIWLKYIHNLDNEEVISLMFSPQVVNMRDYNDNILKICIEQIHKLEN